MATGVEKNVNSQKAIKSKTISGNITLDSHGYYNISEAYDSSDPDHLVRPSGMKNFLFALMWGYGNMTGDNRSVTVDARGSWISGAVNATINGIMIRYFYTD